MAKNGQDEFKFGMIYPLDLWSADVFPLLTSCGQDEQRFGRSRFLRLDHKAV